MTRALATVATILLATGCANDASLVNAPAPGCDETTAESSPITNAALTRTPRRATIAPVVAPASFAATDAAELVRAMGREPDASMPPSLMGSPLAAAVFSGLGELEPTEGSSVVWLSTGIAGAGTGSAVGEATDGTQDGTSFGLGGCEGSDTFDCVRLTYSFVAPADAHSVRFDFNFLSTEYPEYLNQGYNDKFFVSLDSESHSYENISFDSNGHPIGIDSALFDDGCEQMEGTGFDLVNFDACDAGATGLLGTIAPIEPGETVTLTFTLNDAGDGIYDSAVMIDNLQTTSNEIEDPTTNDCE